MALSPGSTLQNGKYKLQQTLGKGGFGLTYRAEHTVAQAPLVLKSPNDDLRVDPEYPKFVDRFLKEGKTLWTLSQKRHPHIVRVTDLFEERGVPWLVMDYIRGESLFDRVQRKGALPEAEAIGFMGQMGSALLAVHGAQLVHRDAHPGNIMILPPDPTKTQREAILIDFGIAGEMFPSTVSSKFFGNPAFAPYEQFGMPADPLMDVYTLAASCYFAVTGVFPESAMNRKLYGRGLVAPRQHRGTLSQGLNAAILAGMALEARNRPSLAEWLKLLQTQGSGVTRPSVQPSFWDRLKGEKAQPKTVATVPANGRRVQNAKQGQARPKTAATVQAWNVDAVLLKSEKGVDYTRLRDLLKAGQWKEADQETYKRMLEATGRTKEGWFRSEDLLNFPCPDLKTIDRLWVQASQGRYGFSVQRSIYVKCGGKLDGNYPGYTIWIKFGEEVGWRVNNSWVSYGDLDWGSTGVPGHLPVGGGRYVLFGRLGWVWSLLSHRDF